MSKFRQYTRNPKLLNILDKTVLKNNSISFNFLIIPCIIKRLFKFGVGHSRFIMMQDFFIKNKIFLTIANKKAFYLQKYYQKL